jgi:hypothetical protein
LVARAHAAGALRRDAGTVDVLMLVRAVAAAVAGIHASHPTLYRRYLTLAFAGLRPGDEAPLDPAPPTIGELIAAKFVSRSSAASSPRPADRSRPGAGPSSSSP